MSGRISDEKALLALDYVLCILQDFRDLSTGEGLVVRITSAAYLGEMECPELSRTYIWGSNRN